MNYIKMNDMQTRRDIFNLVYHTIKIKSVIFYRVIPESFLCHVGSLLSRILRIWRVHVRPGIYSASPHREKQAIMWGGCGRHTRHSSVPAGEVRYAASGIRKERDYYSSSCRLASLSDSQAGRHSGMQAGMKASREAGMQGGRQAGRQAGRQTDRLAALAALI